MRNIVRIAPPVERAGRTPGLSVVVHRLLRARVAMFSNYSLAMLFAGIHKWYFMGVKGEFAIKGILPPRKEQVEEEAESTKGGDDEDDVDMVDLN